MIKVLQVLIGASVGWGFLFSSVMSISENPWYNTVLGMVVGLVIFGWGLRPILGKGAIKYVFIGTLCSAGSIAVLGLLGVSPLSPYLGFLSLLAIIWFSFRIIRWIVRTITSKIRNYRLIKQRRKEDIQFLYRKMQEIQNESRQD